MTVDVITFGCRLNAYESEVIRQQAKPEAGEHLIVFNTCAVTAEAERQARQAIRKARREHPAARIIVTGCAAQIDPMKYAGMAEVNDVLGNEEKLKAENYGTGGAEKIRVNDIMSVRETALHLVQGFEGRARAFVQVQNGCNHRCTFCIIPFGRGNSRSVPMGEIVAQVRALVAQGYKEVVLTGVDISDYGSDLPGTPSLGQMVRRLLALVPELPRLRISSIDAVEVDEDMYQLIAEEKRLMPHFHLSLQSGDDMILKRMKRRHSRRDALDFCARVRSLRPDVVFGADIIAGFPTETEAMFENTLHFVKEANITYLHVFPFSPRPGTPASRMPQVEKNIIRQRAKRLRDLGGLQLEAYLASHMGRQVRVLMEEGKTGRTEHFAPVQLEHEMQPGTLLSASVYGCNHTELKARAA